MFYVFAWIILSFFVAAQGSTRRLGFWASLILSLLFSPIIGLLFVIASPRVEKNTGTSSGFDINQYRQN
ncbi:MAG: hypothetical protein ABJG41_09830 [Cyclobacteriaceae bacterium]